MYVAFVKLENLSQLFPFTMSSVAWYFAYVFNDQPGCFLENDFGFLGSEVDYMILMTAVMMPGKWVHEMKLGMQKSHIAT